MLCGVLGVQAQDVVVDFVSPSIVRVRVGDVGCWGDNGTGVCTWKDDAWKDGVKVKRRVSGDEVRYATNELVVSVRGDRVSFVDRRSGQELLRQEMVESEKVWKTRVVEDEGSARSVETANGRVTERDVARVDTTGECRRYVVRYGSEGERALYGLGSGMEDYVNLLGKSLYLTQHNLKMHVPVLCSTKGYGLLFDAGCAMKFVSEVKGAETTYSMELDAAKVVDYYFFKGETLHDVVRGYHELTGRVSLMPRYVFGYTQSKERYASSDELVGVVKEYRRRGVPLDMIVQDWNYWPQGWGYMKMDRRWYPSPRALADSVHGYDAKLMISIWPNPQRCPEADDFKRRGLMLGHDVYDAFSEEGRRLYWEYARSEFFANGFDAWWCDSSEPLDGDWNRMPEPRDGRAYGWDDHERRWELNKKVLSEALGRERSSLYSLYHSRGIYENQRREMASWGDSAKRVVNLTRSSYAGQQRYGTIVWNGDTHASWQSMRQQMASGLNYMATGNPYWTVDVGSFFTRNDGKRWFYKGEFPGGVDDEGYREYYVRMFQWATFLPMLRSHGSDTPREIWRFGEAGTPYYDAILGMIRLRYSLVPYIYSMAARQTMESYTMARPLAFDFAGDDEVLDMGDEYLFGDMLVCPVTEPGAVSRSVYLPRGVRWTDYWTGCVYDGGQWIEAEAGLDRLPLYVKVGTIVPLAEVAHCTGAQVGKPVTLRVYGGADGELTLYEDEGDNYNYEQGAYSLIPLSWDERRRVLTIGRRRGGYRGMAARRVFVVETPCGVKRVDYRGKKVKVLFGESRP